MARSGNEGHPRRAFQFAAPLADHQTMLDVLLQRRAELPLELGELFEDASNAYMEMSERISQRFLSARNTLLE